MKRISVPSIRFYPFLSVSFCFLFLFTGCAHVYAVKSGFYAAPAFPEPKLGSEAVLVLSPRAANRMFLGGTVMGVEEVDFARAFREAWRVELSAVYRRVELSSSAYKPRGPAGPPDSVLVYPSGWLKWNGVYLPSGTLLLQAIVEAPDLGRSSVFWASAPYSPQGPAFIPFFFPLCDPILAGCPLYDRKAARARGSAFEAALTEGLRELFPELRREAEKIESLRRAGALRDAGRPARALRVIADAAARYGFDEDLGCRAVAASHAPGLHRAPRLPRRARDWAGRARAAMGGRDADVGEAIQDTRRALELAPWWSDGFYDLAALLAKTGRYYEASEALLCFLQSNPPNTKAVVLKIADLRKRAVSDPAARLGSPSRSAGQGAAVRMGLPPIEAGMIGATGVVRLMGLALKPAWCFWGTCHLARADSVMPGSPAWSAGFRAGDDLPVDLARGNAALALPFVLSAWPGEIVPVTTF